MAVNVPLGTAVCLARFQPQHTSEPCAVNPQEWYPPERMELNRPDGASVSPLSLPPQHSMEPLWSSPHE